MKKIVIVTGGFDPIHSGHIRYFAAAKELGDILVVGLNSDDWLKRKKGKYFMPFPERFEIVSSLKMVDEVISFMDGDNTAIDAISQVKQKYPTMDIIFANGGDRTKENIPEMIFSDVSYQFGVGGSNKQNSSSWILEEWKAPKTTRTWGYYREIYNQPHTKVKELVVEPGKSLSMQKHFYRNEHWHVVEGVATVKLKYRKPGGSEEVFNYTLYPHHTLNIPLGVWHQLSNQSSSLLKIAEIQYGEKCEEDDIERT